MNEYTYTYDPTIQAYPYRCDIGGWVFEDEISASGFCQMWNEYQREMARIQDAPAVLSRAEYEAVCNQLGVAIHSDADCDSYGVKYGDFVPRLGKNGENAGYTPAYALEMELAYRRLCGIEQEQAAQTRNQQAQPIISVSRGQLWQECEKPGCNNEPVCLNCFLCDEHCSC